MGRLRCALATLVAGVLLVACSDDDLEPKLSDPTPSAASTSRMVSASPSVSTTPALEPAEVVHAWVTAWNDALRSGDTSALSSYESPSCRNCGQLSGVIDQVTSKGGSFSGGEWSIVSAKEVPITETRMKVNVALQVAAGSTVNSAGEEPVNFGAEKRIAVYELQGTSGTWLIDVIELLS
jgi:hypothetical protein